MHAIEEIAELVHAQPHGFAPQATKRACALLITDLIAATAGGLATSLALSAREAASELYGSGGCSVWLTATTSSALGAAMANASAASALDIDDGHRGAAGHPGAGIIPAAFAIGQLLNSSDEEIFDAIILGYDVALRIAAARPISTIDTYCSGRWVNFGAAVVAGRLLRLRPDSLAHAIAIAGAEGPIGIIPSISSQQGSSVKESIPPAVVVGLCAAFRARAGATGPIDLLDRDDLFQRDKLTSDFGQQWWVEDCYVKPYACCRWIHAAVDAIETMRVAGAPVQFLRIETFAQGLRLPNERAPRTLEGAQYSYYFTCALAAVHGGAALLPIAHEALTDKETLELASRIELAAHDDFASSFPAQTPCRVIMDQGRGLETLTVTHPLGDVANPMDRNQVIDKFNRLATVTVAPDNRNRIAAALDSLETLGFRPLWSALEDR